MLLARAALGLGLVVLASAQMCDIEYECEFNATDSQNNHLYFDFEPLCRDGSTANPGSDYFFNDGVGHDYYSNICGIAAAKCLPKEWVATYELGVAVQFFGDVPPCDLTNPSMYCLEKNGQIPACCTADCQVLGVGVPHYQLVNPSNGNGGVKLTYTAAPPDPDDPFWCPWNPATGAQYPRTVSMILQCNSNVRGAVEIQAIQNASESCDYTLVWETDAACPKSSFAPLPIINNKPSKGLNGGIIFLILLIVGIFVYVVGGMLYVYHTERIWAFPNRHFWRGLPAKCTGKKASSGSYTGGYDGGSKGGYTGGVPTSTPYSDI